MADDKNDEYDFSGAPLPPGYDSEGYARFRELAREQVTAEVLVKDLKADLAAAEAAYGELRDNKVPAAAQAVGISKVEFDGLKVVVGPEVVGKLPEEPIAKAEALALLTSMGEADSIKRTITIDLGKDQADLEKRLLEGIARVAPNAAVKTNVTINHQTLCAIAREYVRKGKIVDYSKLGLIPIRRARITKGD